MAYFPIIYLCLICEAFTKALDEKGPAEAAWPTANTVLIAVLITLIARVPGTLHVLLRFPELPLAQTGIVLLIGEYLHFEFLKGKNPFVRKSAIKTQFEENTLVQQILLPVNTRQIGGPSV